MASGADVAVPAAPGGVARQWLTSTNGGLLWSPTIGVSDLTEAVDLKQVLAGGFFPEKYGARGDGTVDDTPAVQACWNAAAAAGGTAILKAIYRCDSQLKAPSGLDCLLAMPATQLIKNFATSGGTTNAFIVSGDGTLATPHAGDDITIRGPGTIKASSLAMTGGIISIRGDRFKAKEFKITCWAQGRAVYGAGDKWRSWDVTITGSDGLAWSGGWRYVGGQGSRFYGMHIESGDDALQFVPSGSSADPLFNLSISDCRYVECTGRSFSARFMVVANVSPVLDSMSCSITNVGFDYCDGFGNARGLMIMNRDSHGVIDGVQVIGGSTDMSLSASFTATGAITTGSPVITGLSDTSLMGIGDTVAGTGIPGGAHVLTIDSGTQITLDQNATQTNAAVTLTFGAFSQSLLVNKQITFNPNVGAIRNILIRDHEVKNPIGTSSTFLAVGGVENMVIEGGKWPASPNANSSVIQYDQVTTGRISGGRIDCLGYPVSGVITGVGGTNAKQSNDVVVEGTRIVGVPNGKWGVNFNCCVGGTMQRVRVEQYAGATTAQAWRATALSSGIKIIGANDFGQLTSSPKFTDLATDTVVRDNLGDSTNYDDVWASPSGDQAYTSNTTLADVPGLGIAVRANTSYQVDGYIVYDADAAGDLNLKLTIPTGATLNVAYFGAAAAATTTNASITVGDKGAVSQINGGVGAGTLVAVYVRGKLDVGSTAGTLQLQAAQGSSSAVASTLRAAGTFLHAQRIR